MGVHTEEYRAGLCVEKEMSLRTEQLVKLLKLKETGSVADNHARIVLGRSSQNCHKESTWQASVSYFGFLCIVKPQVCAVNINEVPISSIQFKKSVNQWTHMLRRNKNWFISTHVFKYECIRLGVTRRWLWRMDVTQCGSSENRHFGAMYHLHLQGRKNVNSNVVPTSLILCTVMM
jgi:hypothetical protein